MRRILIIGKIPPPIGGVTVHVQRLIAFLRRDNIAFRFLKLSLLNLIILPLILPKYRLVHLHTSSIKVQLIISFFCELMNVKCIITFHGDINRFNEANLRKVEKIIKRITVPIVLNESSLEFARNINSRSRLISSFLPPLHQEKLPYEIIQKILNLRNNYQYIYSTNAYALTYDKENQEIYGIVDLIEYFNNEKYKCLIISDPSSQYKNYIKNNKIRIKKNILVINTEHSFYEVLKLSDVCIRNTSTDGDSLSIKEALYLNKITFTTDVVSRPKGVILYKRGEYNFDILNHFNKEDKEDFQLSAREELIKLYNKL